MITSYFKTINLVTKRISNNNNLNLISSIDTKNNMKSPLMIKSLLHHNLLKFSSLLISENEANHVNLS
jgi:hypothetical protein